MIFDIGGGSTELVLIEPGGAGAADPRLAERALGRRLADRNRRPRGEDTGDAARARALCRRCAGWCAKASPPFAERVAGRRARHDLRLLGTSGTVTTLASLHLELPQYDRKAVDGLIVPARLDARDQHAAVRHVAGRARKLPCIGSERADLVVAGCAILEAILDIWPARAAGRGRSRHSRRHPAQPDGGRQPKATQARAALQRSRSGRRQHEPLRQGPRQAGQDRARAAPRHRVRWLERQLNDPYVKQAKAEGYRSRAAYKLIELDERFGLLKGVSRRGRSRHRAGRLEPGGAQARAEGAGRRDRPAADRTDRGRDDLRRWISWPTPRPQALTDALGGPPDLVLSDMAANTVGHKQTDHLRTMGLVEAAA